MSFAILNHIGFIHQKQSPLDKSYNKSLKSYICSKKTLFQINYNEVVEVVLVVLQIL